jgi:tripartite-type tricarboxylate transporter receptor subunit TctC
MLNQCVHKNRATKGTIEMHRCRPYFALIVALAGVSLAEPALSLDWPQRPVRVLVPFGAGGSSDTITRFIAQRLGERFSQQFVVENRPGAAGVVAAEAVMRAPPDGYTLMMGNRSQLTIAPAVAKTPYDPVKDFAPISIVGTNPFVLVVHPSIPADNLADFVAYVRKQPQKLPYAASGAGSLSHLGMALFLKRAGIELTAVTYKGGAQPLADVLAGHVPIYLANLSAVVPHATSGTLRLLAVSGEKRTPQLPQVPTFIEAGFEFTTYTWQGLVAPAGTPKEIIDKVAQEVARVVKDPKILEHLAADGYDALGNAPGEFAAMISADIALWAEAVRLAGAGEK